MAAEMGPRLLTSGSTDCPDFRRLNDEVSPTDGRAGRRGCCAEIRNFGVLSEIAERFAGFRTEHGESNRFALLWSWAEQCGGSLEGSCSSVRNRKQNARGLRSYGKTGGNGSAWRDVLQVDTRSPPVIRRIRRIADCTNALWVAVKLLLSVGLPRHPWAQPFSSVISMPGI